MRKNSVLMYKLCHEDLSPANPSCSKNAHVDKEVCNRRAKQFKAAVTERKAAAIRSGCLPLSPQLRLSGTGLPGAVSTKARNQLGIDVATKLVAIKANLGSSEAPRGVDEMITLDHMADSGSD